MKLRRFRRESRKLKGEVTSRYLGHGNAALPRQLLFRLLAGVRVGQVRVEILVEDLRRLLAEVAALATRVQETASGNSDILFLIVLKRPKLSWLARNVSRTFHYVTEY